jgi:hypothetical protein
VILALAVQTAPGPREDIRFPDDAGVHSVREFGAKGDGVADDTDALMSAFQKYSNRHMETVYLPNGTYLVSRQVWFAEWILVQGQSRAGTVIRLKDSCLGFQDPANPCPVVGLTNPRKGNEVRNMNFRTHLLNVTIETGQGNPGAIGVEYMSHNGGGLEDVTVRCGKAGGPIGIDMRRSAQGPSFCRRVRVEGFDVGIEISPSVTASAFEDIDLVGQKAAGVALGKHPVSFRRLRVQEGQGPALLERETDCEPGQAVIVDSVFSGPPGVPAVDATRKAKFGDMGIYLRRVEVKGHAVGVKNTDGSTVEPARLLGEWYTGKPLSAFPFPEPKSLNLPVKETPPMPWEDPRGWANVLSFGAVRLDDATRRPTDRWDWFGGGPIQGHDVTDAFQKAIDSGKGTVYLPHGHYLVRKPIHVRGKVRVIQACGSVIWADRASPDFKGKDGAALLVDGPGAEPVFIDRATIGATAVPGDPVWGIRHASPRTLVVMHSGPGSLTDGPGAGDLFLEDVCAAPVRLTQKHNVWARSLDVESDKEKLTNQSGALWVLGYKTEGTARDGFTGPGASTEILGGTLYPGMKSTDGIPSFEVQDGRFSAVITRYWSHKMLLKETRRGETKTVMVEHGSRLVDLLLSR